MAVVLSWWRNLTRPAGLSTCPVVTVVCARWRCGHSVGMPQCEITRTGEEFHGKPVPDGCRCGGHVGCGGRGSSAIVSLQGRCYFHALSRRGGRRQAGGKTGLRGRKTSGAFGAGCNTVG